MKKFKNYIAPILGLVVGGPLLASTTYLTVTSFHRFYFNVSIWATITTNINQITYILILLISIWMLIASIKSLSSKLDLVFKKKNRIIGYLLILLIAVIIFWAAVGFIYNCNDCSPGAWGPTPPIPCPPEYGEKC